MIANFRSALPIRLPSWLKMVGKGASGLAIIVTIVGFALHWQSLGDDQELLFPDGDYTVKGSRPTTSSLDLGRSDSRASLFHYLEIRQSQKKEDKELAKTCLRRILDNERNLIDYRTLALILTVKGDFHLYHGELTPAVEALEEAHALDAKNLWATARLLRAYKQKAQMLRQEDIPWSQETQEILQQLGEKIDALEKDLAIKVRIGALRILEQEKGDAAGPFMATDGFPGEGLFEFVGSPTGDMPYVFVIDASGGKPFKAHREVRGGFLYSDEPLFLRVDAGGSIEVTWTANSALTSGIGAGDTFRVGVWPLNDTHNGAALLPDRSGSAGFCRGPRAPTETRANVLAIGLDDYDPATGFEPLRFVERDVRRVSTAFEALGFETVTVTNKAATKRKVLHHLAREVLTSGPGDVFVLFVSGHGFTDPAGNAVLVTDGGDDVVSLAEIEVLLSYHRGRAVVVLDTCLDRRDLDHRTGDIAVALHGNSRPLIFAAGAPDGVAIESGKLGSGVFTHAVVSYLEGLRDQGATAGDLNFENLFDFTVAETARLARLHHGVEQHPQQLQ